MIQVDVLMVAKVINSSTAMTLQSGFPNSGIISKGKGLTTALGVGAITSDCALIIKSIFYILKYFILETNKRWHLNSSNKLKILLKMPLMA